MADAAQTARDVVRAATAETTWLRAARKRWPRVRHLILSAPKNAWWALLHRFHPNHQYNIVRTGLPPGYYDEDTRMMHAMMACLGEFVRAHGGVEKLDEWTAELRAPPTDEGPVSHTSQADMQEEAATIWRWWSETRPRERQAHEDECMRLFGDGGIQRRGDAVWNSECDAHRDEDLRLDAADQAMLHRLIEIRQGLWT